MAAGAATKIGRIVKCPKLNGLYAKLAAVMILGMCFIFTWSFFSSTPADSVTSRWESFSSDIAQKKVPVVSSSSSSSSSSKVKDGKEKVMTQTHSYKSKKKKPSLKEKEKEKGVEVKNNVTVSVGNDEDGSERSDDEVVENGEGEGEGEKEGEDVSEGGEESGQGDHDLEEGLDVKLGDDGDGESGGNDDSEGSDDSEEVKGGNKGKSKKRGSGPLFDPKARYSWALCSVRSKHNYIPCIDIESPTGKLQRYRHLERSCPKTPPMCLVPLPTDGYGTPVRWPESKFKILYKNVAHPKLAAHVNTESWVMESGDYLLFPQNQSRSVGGIAHYLESLEEMVPDIEWGKNVRVVLDIGVTDSSFAVSLLDKDVLTLSLGLKDDLVDWAQVAIERGFAAIVNPFGTRRLPFPSGVFDAIHCSGCNIHWHSKGGKLLIEVNRILRPGGYFVLSAKQNSIEEEEAMTSLTASICWNTLADKSDDATGSGIRIYQKPESNGIYELRRKKNPPLCKESENPDAAWNVPIRHCLHLIPAAIEERGSEWPVEWPKRLDNYPDWLVDKEKVRADTQRWKDIVEKSYLSGIGIDWTRIRNVMDMKALYGGFAASLSQKNVWVMNVVPVHAPSTLPYIYERGLIGVYHDWCESFGTYPRSYDLLHADHLFSRLKNRCNQPVAIVVEMDRLLRPGGWAIVRDKVVILEPLEGIFRNLNWEIRMTFAHDKEGILVAEKTTWRP